MQQPTLIDLSGYHEQRPDERVVFDFYETPFNVTRSFGRLLGSHLAGKRVLEPCVGDGAIAAILREDEFGCYVTSNDLDPTRAAHTCIDAGNPALYLYHSAIEAQVSNPPFDQALTITANAVEFMRKRSQWMRFVAHLLPLNFMEPVEDRRVFLSEHPPQHRIPTERIRFRKDIKSTAPISTEWIIWTRDGSPLEGVPTHGVLLWKHL